MTTSKGEGPSADAEAAAADPRPDKRHPVRRQLFVSAAPELCARFRAQFGRLRVSCGCAQALAARRFLARGAFGSIGFRGSERGNFVCPSRRAWRSCMNGSGVGKA